MTVKPAIIPCVRYKDAPAAIDFLCNAFGFTRHAVYPDEKDPSVIQHAQLVKDGNMIMVSSALDSDYAKKARMKTPAEAGANTQGIYVVIDDVDAHAVQATRAGAEILMPPKDEDYGGRGYSVFDLEGYVWSFGSYDPWADQTAG